MNHPLMAAATLISVALGCMSLLSSAIVFGLL